MGNFFSGISPLPLKREFCKLLHEPRIEVQATTNAIDINLMK